MQRHRADNIAVVAQKIDDAEIARLANAEGLVHHRPQGFRNRRPGVEKVHINAAWTIVARCHRLGDAPRFAGPTDAPIVHGPSSHKSCASGALHTPRPAASVSW